MFSDRTVVGLYDRRGFQLRVNIWYMNSFQTILYGRVRVDNDATHVSCTARMRTFVIVFMAIWFGLTLLLGGGAALYAVASMRAGDMSTENFVAVFTLVLMLAFAVGLVHVGRSWSSDDERALLAFLEETIDATPV